MVCAVEVNVLLGVTQNYGMSYLEPRNMKATRTSFKFWSSVTPLALVLAFVSTGCGSLMQRTANLEDDELYLGRGEAFMTDAEYLAHAYEQAGYTNGEAQEDDLDARSGDGFQSSFGYVPQSLRGRTMLRGYLTPYGAAGFGPNPYDPWASSFYSGYGAYNPGLVDPYGSWCSSTVGGGWGTNSWGVNPYMGNTWGMNGWGGSPYASQMYGSGLYGYNPYGFGYGGFYGASNGFGAGWATDPNVSGTPIVVSQRTPIWTASAVNSNGRGGRLMDNKNGNAGQTESSANPTRTIWRSTDSGSNSARNNPSSGRQGSWTAPPASSGSSTSGSSKNWNTSGRSSQPSTRPSSNHGGNRGSNWSRPSSGSSRNSGTSTRPSTGRSTGSSTGRSGGTTRSSGRGGHPQR